MKKYRRSTDRSAGERKKLPLKWPNYDLKIAAGLNFRLFLFSPLPQFLPSSPFHKPSHKVGKWSRRRGTTDRLLYTDVRARFLIPGYMQMRPSPPSFIINSTYAPFSPRVILHFATIESFATSRVIIESNDAPTIARVEGVLDARESKPRAKMERVVKRNVTSCDEFWEQTKVNRKNGKW